MSPLRSNSRFVINTNTNEVEIGSRKIKLSPKETGVLDLLNSHSGTTLGRTEILERVWGSQSANDQGLTQTISRLREVLSGSGASIKTIPKKGYLLQKREVKARRLGYRWIRVNVYLILIMLLLFSICILVFIKRIEIRVDKMPVNTESPGASALNLVRLPSQSTI